MSLYCPIRAVDFWYDGELEREVFGVGEACGSPLYVIWSATVPIEEDGVIHGPSKAISTSWHIECEEGHRIAAYPGAEDRADAPSPEVVLELVRRMDTNEATLVP